MKLVKIKKQAIKCIFRKKHVLNIYYLVGYPFSVSIEDNLLGMESISRRHTELKII